MSDSRPISRRFEMETGNEASAPSCGGLLYRPHTWSASGFVFMYVCMYGAIFLFSPRLAVKYGFWNSFWICLLSTLKPIRSVESPGLHLRQCTVPLWLRLAVEQVEPYLLLLITILRRARFAKQLNPLFQGTLSNGYCPLTSCFTCYVYQSTVRYADCWWIHDVELCYYYWRRTSLFAGGATSRLFQQSQSSTIIPPSEKVGRL